MDVAVDAGPTAPTVLTALTAGGRPDPVRRRCFGLEAFSNLFWFFSFANACSFFPSLLSDAIVGASLFACCERINFAGVNIFVRHNLIFAKILQRPKKLNISSLWKPVSSWH